MIFKNHAVTLEATRLCPYVTTAANSCRLVSRPALLHTPEEPERPPLTLIRSRGCVQQAAPHDASPPKYHLDMRFSVIVLVPGCLPMRCELYFLPLSTRLASPRCPAACLRCPACAGPWWCRSCQWPGSSLTHDRRESAPRSGGLWAPVASRAHTPHDARVCTWNVCARCLPWWSHDAQEEAAEDTREERSQLPPWTSELPTRPRGQSIQRLSVGERTRRKPTTPLAPLSGGLLKPHVPAPVLRSDGHGSCLFKRRVLHIPKRAETSPWRTHTHTLTHTHTYTHTRWGKMFCYQLVPFWCYSEVRSYMKH